MGRLSIMSADGQEEYTWDVSSPAEVEAAREKFNRCLKENMIAFKTVTGSKEAILLRRFDPAAEEIFMLGLAGGG